MSSAKEIAISKQPVPIFAVIILAVIFALGLFIVGYDQGHLLSMIQGADAFDELFFHELMHDMRHAAGFPCH